MAVRIIDGKTYQTLPRLKDIVVGKEYKLLFKKKNHKFFLDCILISMPDNFRSILHMERSDFFEFSNNIKLYMKPYNSSCSLGCSSFPDNVEYDVSIWKLKGE